MKTSWLLRPLNRFGSHLSTLFFPPTCAACDRPLHEGEESVCLSCIMNLPYTNFHLQADNALMGQFKGKVTIEAACACFYFRKGEQVQHLLHQLKYRRNKAAAFFVGKMHGELLKRTQWYRELEAIIPVPLHHSKLKQRGYNQSEEYGSGLAKALNIPLISNVLIRTKQGDSQTSKTREERFQSLSNSFLLSPSNPINEKDVLLVDDVITSGATIEVCAALLHTANCRVSVASMAFTQRH